MDDGDWDAVLRNCCLLYGWKANSKTGQMERAATPAFRLRKKTIPSSRQDATDQQIASEDTAVPHTDPVQTEQDLEPPQDNYKSTNKEKLSQKPDQMSKAKSPSILTAKDVAVDLPTKPGAIPSYAINDQSRIAVTVVSSDFQESMARNHFSSSTIEGGV
jgi:hypothetical protein